MKYRGTVVNGVVVLPPGAKLPDGTNVEVSPQPTGPALGNREDELTLAETFGSFLGVFNDLPVDLAENHDHYLYGLPKK